VQIHNNNSAFILDNDLPRWQLKAIVILNSIFQAIKLMFTRVNYKLKHFHQSTITASVHSLYHRRIHMRYAQNKARDEEFYVY